jgi:hypothetical protein
MSKAHRGTPLKQEQPKSGRGTDPVTGQTGVKLLYEVELDGKKVKVSKTGKATLANIKKREEKEGRKAAAAAAPAPAVEEKPVEEPAAEEKPAEEAAAAEPAADESVAETETAEPEKAESEAAPAADESSDAGEDAPAEEKES